MKYLLGLLIVLMLANVYAFCESGQINVNSASLEKLDELSGIGPVKAQAIIDTRPFDSVDDLIKVYGIGEITLQKIKEQGLACVDGEEEEQEEPDNEKDSEQSFVLAIPDLAKQEEPISIQKKNIELEIITLNSLNSKDIKSKNSTENSGINYAKYGFVGFCVLLAVLFILKKPKQELD